MHEGLETLMGIKGESGPIDSQARPANIIIIFNNLNSVWNAVLQGSTSVKSGEGDEGSTPPLLPLPSSPGETGRAQTLPLSSGGRRGREREA